MSRSPHRTSTGTATAALDNAPDDLVRPAALRVVHATDGIDGAHRTVPLTARGQRGQERVRVR
ncbi:hypothetical protein [Streptomyces sp. CT34]|uniref:hypothetical protein n=1 Tax=Streptomyces sp. CT34 TaxID=1553907 RepID=UPI0005B9F635|nr:hypothetical protein [Streptomyces sp. CT34]